MTEEELWLAVGFLVGYVNAGINEMEQEYLLLRPYIEGDRLLKQALEENDE